MTSARKMIAAYLFDYASLCRQKGESSSEPAADQATADRLEELAEYVLTLPEGDWRLQVLSKFAIYDGMDVVAPGPTLSSVIANYPYRMPHHSGDLLDSLVAAAGEEPPETPGPWQNCAPVAG